VSAERSEQDVQESVGRDFVIMGRDRVEVSVDGKKVTAYTNGAVEPKAAPRLVTWGIIRISGDFNTVVLNGTTIERAADGHLVISSPGIIITTPYAANDDPSKATTHEIGTIESRGEHKGEIYGGIYPADNKPLWFSGATKAMDHYRAAAWAEGQGGSLPTRMQGDYLTALKGKGGPFTEIFNRGSSFPAGSIWLAESLTNDGDYAWCQRLSDGAQDYTDRDVEMPVLSVRR